ncbi:MAG: HAD-IC family P-type ATPase [archaeon]
MSNNQKIWNLKKEEVISHFQSTSSGLSQKEAELRLERYGKNIIKETYKISPLKIFLSQFKSFLVYILIAAVLISLFISHYVDAGVIFAIVLLNAAIGFFQQYKAEKSILELKKLLVPKTQVLRDKKIKDISSENIVPGDILIFEEGDKITADCRILELESLEVSESVLTGESLPIEKIDTILRGDTIIADRKNMLFTGTSIVRGHGKAIVIATGMNTEFGKIASSLQEISIQETPMQKKLDSFAKQISIVVIIIAALMFTIGILTGQDKVEMFLTAIAIIVSAIPEGLPAVITIALAFATKTMLKNNVIVRRLPAAETLGSVTIICSDKTGTLTEERMAITDIYCNNNLYQKQEGAVMLGNKKIDYNGNANLSQLFKISLLCNNAHSQIRETVEKGKEEYDILGDPTEAALILSSLDLGISKKALSEQEPRVKEITFTSTRKMMSLIRKSGRRNILYSKGAASVILEKCAFEFINGKIEKLSPSRRNYLMKIAENLESKALRVLAFSFRNLTEDDMKKLKSDKEEEIEQGLIFSGFMGMLDPPRKEIKEAIRLSKAAGVKVKIITGDSPLTARAIAKQIGLTGKMIDGKELEKITDEQLKKEIDDIVIFARIEPKQKLRIVEILKIKGETVAITGDGVNDVLALKKADIGIAMGIRGSDVAREVSDMILVDDNFASIVKANEQGRVVYDNSKKATKFLLASNLGEILIVAYSILFRLPLPILPLQILWVNLVTDSIPALALTAEKGDDVMSSGPRKEKSVLEGILGFIIFGSLVSLISTLLIFNYALNHLGIQKAQTMVMMTLIGFEAFFVFSCRSNKSLKDIGLFSNKYIIYAFLSVIILQLILIYTPLSLAFKVVKLSLSEWSLVLVASLSGLFVFEAYKLIEPLIKKIKKNKKGKNAR